MALENKVVGIIVAMFILGAIGGVAFNFSASNFSAADSAVQTVVGTLVPILAAVGIGMLFLRRR